MSKALWPAVSGAMARDLEVEVIANNLANTNTNGFKKDSVEFKEYLSKNEKMSDLTQDIPRSPIKDKDLYPMEGRDQSYVIVNGTRTSMKTGGLKVTDNPLDVALDGPGFLEINTPGGIRYTKAGALKIAADGKLVTTDGHPILSQGEIGADPAGRTISVADRDGQIHINEKGEIYVADELVATMNIVEFGDLRPVRKIGSLNYENKDTLRNPPQVAVNTILRQGVIETSNVNPVEELSALIKANRLFEQDLKAMKTVNEMLQREVNDIGKF